MCFYDQFVMNCGDYKWGHFRQHCSKEYRTGETCGMKLAMYTYQKADKCKTCEKIITKRGRLEKEQKRIDRWIREERHSGVTRTASIEASEKICDNLHYEITKLEEDREWARNTL